MQMSFEYRIHTPPSAAAFDAIAMCRDKRMATSTSIHTNGGLKFTMRPAAGR